MKKNSKNKKIKRLNVVGQIQDKKLKNIMSKMKNKKQTSLIKLPLLYSPQKSHPTTILNKVI